MQDEIRREIIIKASAKQVYDAIIDPKKIIKWFPDKVEGNIEVGNQPIFTFDHGRTSVYILAAKPYEYFAYRWVPGGPSIVEDLLSVPTTLIEFHIEEQGSQTKVTLTESGFASLPIDLAKKGIKNNSGGWEYMINRLKKFLETD
jgi:uncharacterized protein YndB with AHSA1/START domain